MKKIITIVLIVISSLSVAVAQDLIIRRSGQDIKGKVQMITDNEISFLQSDSTVGKIAKSEVLLIMYANGTKDIFSEAKPSESSSNLSANPNITVVRPTQQYVAYDFFDRKVPVILLGIDFSHCVLTGGDFENPKQLFNDLNNMLIKEKLKYDFDGAIRRFSMPYSFSYVEKLNQELDEKKLVQTSSNRTLAVNPQSIIDAYDFTGTDIKDGMGMILICQEMDARRKQAIYCYAIFDIQSKKVEIYDNLVGKAGGAGLRNYWARTIYETMVEVKDTKYGQWKKMYRK